MDVDGCCIVDGVVILGVLFCCFGYGVVGGCGWVGVVCVCRFGCVGGCGCGVVDYWCIGVGIGVGGIVGLLGVVLFWVVGVGGFCIGCGWVVLVLVVCLGSLNMFW